MKRIIYIHQYFRTPHEGGAIRSYYIARAMVEAGWCVDMITSHNEKEYRFSMVEGIKVHYLPVSYDNKMSYLNRIRAFLSFIVSSLRQARKIRDAEICYATSTPLTVGIIALLLKKWQKIPYIFEVRDLWPEAPIQLGYLPSPILKTVFRRLEKLIYAKANKIIALSPGIADGILHSTPKANVITIPNMSDNQFFDVGFKKPDSNNINIVYTGALGIVNDVEAIIEMANHCQKNHPKVKFYVAGTGKKEAYFKEEINRRQLRNVILLGQIDKYAIKELLSKADIALVSFMQVPILRTNSPNKAFDALAAGLPIIFTNKNWLAEQAEKNHFGVYLDLKNPNMAFQKLDNWLKDQDIFHKSRWQAKKAAEELYDKDVLCRKVLITVDPNYLGSKISELKASSV